MKKRLLLLCLLVSIELFIITGCNGNKINNIPVKEINENNTNTNIESESDNNMDAIKSINVTINNKNYNATLEDNETVREFLTKLPQEFNMSELNGNEKYIYLDYTLPTNSSNSKHIEIGDVMLYGNNCLVIFYKSFDASYSYTKIGHIDNLPDLGSDSVTVKLSK